MEESDIFKITKYCRSHTCSIEILNHDHRQATAKVIGQLNKNKFTGIEHIYKPCYIVEDMMKDYGVNISYDKAWHAREARYDLTRVSENPIIYVSDQMVSISNAIHGLYTWHIEHNLITNFKDSTVVRIFRDAARAFRMIQFQKKWDELLSFLDGIVTKYLEDISLQTWAWVYQIEQRYDNMMSNNAKCFSLLTKEYRLLLIVFLIEHVRGILQLWFYERRNYWASRTTLHSNYCEIRLASEVDKGRRYRVKPINCYQVHVRDNQLDGIMNLHMKGCTFKEFDSLGIPCSHAIFATKERNIPIQSLRSRFYTVDSLMTAYAKPINPLWQIYEWNRAPEYVEKTILPPKFVAQIGQ
ncbi:uncharacterized protein LOC120080944 [Benincasa hispida]|uniref:uncharacterized protein LOC120080944 n=1 Tax=Benincasa hispida TaxID=102211 RepID=UPI0019026024|nr:uncharacterized protein LOC120080944 [Benincasa hispida]